MLICDLSLKLITVLNQLLRYDVKDIIYEMIDSLILVSTHRLKLFLCITKDFIVETQFLLGSAGVLHDFLGLFNYLYNS